MDQLHTKGYVILDTAQEVPPAVLTSLKRKADRAARPIFNYTDTGDRTDNKRTQCNLRALSFGSAADAKRCALSFGAAADARRRGPGTAVAAFVQSIKEAIATSGLIKGPCGY